MTRRKLPGHAQIIRTAITLREGEDDDLLTVFAQVPARRRASFIKAALRHGGCQAATEFQPEDDHLAESINDFFIL